MFFDFAHPWLNTKVFTYCFKCLLRQSFTKFAVFNDPPDSIGDLLRLGPA